MTKFDHIVVCADSLQRGVDYVKEQLGVELPRGGEHVHMGTHNCIMQVGQDIYFEIIAINPDAAAPDRPRWFNMDHASDRAAIARQPGLITWVANTDNLEQCIENATFPYPDGLALSRGDLRWRVTLSDDGTLPAGGMLPTLIEWQVNPHPANNMPDLGCRLESLTIHHPNADWLKGHLSSISADHLVEVVELPKNHSAYLQAAIRCPNGVVTLESAH